MFCRKCGTQLADDDTFCSNCGAHVKEHPASRPAPYASAYASPYSAPDPGLVEYYRVQKEAQRMGELKTLDNLIRHFSQKLDKFDMYDELCAIVARYDSGSPIAMNVWCWIFVALGGFITMMSFSLMGFDNAGAGGGVFLLLLGLGLVTGGIFMFRGGNQKRRKYFQERDSYARQLDQIGTELYNHYLAYPNCPLGVEYVNPYILQALRSTFVEGRADTIKECLNVMIEDANQDAMNEYLNQIERNTAQTRTCAAIFLAASFFR